MLSVTHQWTIHHVLTINPHDASLFAIQPEQGNAFTQKNTVGGVGKGCIAGRYLNRPVPP
jgi:hypothetical protein